MSRPILSILKVNKVDRDSFSQLEKVEMKSLKQVLFQRLVGDRRVESENPADF